MTTLELALVNLGAWSLQVAVLGLVVAILSRLLPVERPAIRLAFGQILLLGILVLPLIQPWQPLSAKVSSSLEPATIDAPAPVVNHPSVSPRAWMPRLLPTVCIILLVGVAARLTVLFLGLARLRSFHRRAEPLDAPPWLRTLRDGVAPRATFFRSASTCMPAAFGVWRPVVLLPPTFDSMDRRHQEAIVLHELLHARYGHWLAVLFEELLRALLFFHPVVHWLVAQARLAREQVVDAEVVQQLGHREAYLDSLVEVARLGVQAHTVPAAPFLRESHLRERVDLLLRGVCMSRLRTVAHVALTATALMLATTIAVSAVPMQADQPGGSTVSNPPEDSRLARESEPKRIHNVVPEYPAEARAESVEGFFVMDVVIGKDGTVREPRVVVSAPTKARLEALKPKRGTPAALEGDARLGSAAIEAVRQWRYAPVIRDGQPVEAAFTVTVSFKLHEKIGEPNPRNESTPMPKLLHRVNPTYPADAFAKRLEGFFLLDIVIGKDGTVTDARVSVSAPTRTRFDELREKQDTALEGDERLAAAAVAAVRQWRFEPQLRDGQPVESTGKAPVWFEIH